MNSKLYVGNLSFQLDEPKLEEVFAQYGSVKSVRIITDRETGRSRGFGFVEMETPEQAQETISSLDGSEVEGRNLRVNIAEEKGGNSRRDNNNRW